MNRTQNDFQHYRVYNDVSGKFGAGDFAGALIASEAVCHTFDNINSTNRATWFYRACSLDMLDRPCEAIVIYDRLIELYPLEPFYRKALSTALERLEIQTLLRYASQCYDETFNECLKIFEKFHYVTWSLRVMQFRYLMQSEKRQELSELLNKYLDLNPYDYDYLSVCFKFSQEIQDHQVFKKALGLIDAIPAVHVDRIRFDGLLFEFFESTQGDRLF